MAKLSGFEETIEAPPRDGAERANHEVVTKTGPPVSSPEGKLCIRDSDRIAMPIRTGAGDTQPRGSRRGAAAPVQTTTRRDGVRQQGWEVGRARPSISKTLLPLKSKGAGPVVTGTLGKVARRAPTHVLWVK